jgi:tetratricopeptide (TPR) repeat protein
MTSIDRLMRAGGGFAAAALAIATSLLAGAAPADVITSGACSPIVTSRGPTWINIACPQSVSTHYVYAVDGAATGALAQHFAISEVAVQNLFKQINGENVPPYLIPERLQQLVTEIKRGRAELEAVAVAEATETLRVKALRALEDGRIDDALALHREMIERFADEEARTVAKLIGFARVHRGAGELYMVKYEYATAVAMFEKAAGLLPGAAALERARALTLWADAFDLSSGDHAHSLRLAREAASAAAAFADADPELYLRALNVEMRAMIDNHDPDGAIHLFETDIGPLLDRDQLRASAWSIFCFACAGASLIDAGDYAGAVRVLERGAAYGRGQVAPDRVALAKIYGNLAVAYTHTGHGDKAPEALGRAKEMLLAAFPDENHPDFADIYVSEGFDSSSTEERARLFLHAFTIVSRILPYTNANYQSILHDVVAANAAGVVVEDDEHRSSVVQVAGFDPGPDYFDALYAVHLENVRRILGDDRESTAKESLQFAALLDAVGRHAQGLRYFARTVALYPAGSTGETLGDASYNAAQTMRRYGIGSDTEIEQGYKRALAAYVHVSGAMSPNSCDARLRLVEFLAARHRGEEASKLIDDFARATQAAADPAVRDHLAELRGLLR